MDEQKTGLADRIGEFLKDALGESDLADLGDVTTLSRDLVSEVILTASLPERAPEVTRLLERIRDEIEEPDGSWSGGDTVALLCEWFTGLGYKIDGPRP